MECKFCNLYKNGNGKCNTEHPEWVSESGSPKWFEPNDYLIFEGSKPAGVFCLNDGMVVLEKTRGSVIFPLRFLKPGSLIGLPAVFTHSPYNHSARALVKTNACFLDSESVFILSRDVPGFGKEAMRQLIDDNDSLEKRLGKVADQNAEQRIASLLLMVWNSYGNPADSFLRYNLSAGLLAQLANTSVKMAQAVCKSFSDNGWIEEVAGLTVNLRSPEMLRKIAGEG